MDGKNNTSNTNSEKTIVEKTKETVGNTVKKVTKPRFKKPVNKNKDLEVEVKGTNKPQAKKPVHKPAPKQTNKVETKETQENTAKVVNKPQARPVNKSQTKPANKPQGKPANQQQKKSAQNSKAKTQNKAKQGVQNKARVNNNNGETKLRIIPIGGMNEIGKNITMYEYGNEAILIDCGMSFPEDELYGIDVVIPDLGYVKKNIKKIKGLIITHGHEDHIGAIPYLLKEVNIPIYGTRLTLGILENKLREHKLLRDAKLNVITPEMRLNFGAFNVEPIRVSHSIPDAVAYCIETPYGNIIHTGDFKIDFNPIDGHKTDLNRFAQYGQRGVLAMFADSTNASRPGYTMSESTVGETIEDIFRHSEARIIVASFASNVHRMQQIVNAAHLNNRKVAFSGRSMLNISKIASELGYLKRPGDLFIDVKDLDRYPDNEVVVITTGSQGEPMSALARMANSEHRQMEIREGDLVIISASPIPGNEKSVSRIINSLSQKGANVIYESLADVHVSGHAKQEELKIIHSIVKPKYFIPIHGEFQHLKHHVDLAVEMGMSHNNIFVLQNGNVLEFDSKGAKMAQSVQAGRVFVDGLGVGDVGNIVLRDRKHLAEDGLINVVVAISKETGDIVSGPDIVSRGFVYVRESEELMKGARKAIDKAFVKCKRDGIRDWSSMKNEVRNSLNDYIYSTTKRNPMILPIFMEV